MGGIHLDVLLLGGGTHLLLERSVGDVETGEGVDANAENGEEDDGCHQGVEDACIYISIS